MDAIKSSRWNEAIQSLEQNPQMNLRQAVGPEKYNVVWLTLHPEWQGLANGDGLLNSKVVRLEGLQVALVKRLVEADRTILSVGNGHTSLAFSALSVYDNLVSQLGKSVAEDYKKKLALMIQNPDQLSEFAKDNYTDGSGYIAGPLVPILLDSGYFNALEYLESRFNLDWTKAYTFTRNLHGRNAQYSLAPLQQYAVMFTHPDAFRKPDPNQRHRFSAKAREHSSLLETRFTDTVGMETSEVTVFELLSSISNDLIIDPNNLEYALRLKAVFSDMILARGHPNLSIGIDPNLFEASSFKPIELALLFGLRDSLEELAESSTIPLSARIIDFALVSAVLRQDFDALDLIIKASKLPSAQLLSRRLNQDSYMYQPTLLNIAVGSIARDGDVNRVMEMIYALIERGVDPESKSGADYTAAMEPRWIYQMILSGEMPVRGEHKPKIFKALGDLERILKSEEFKVRALTVHGTKTGRPFYECRAFDPK